MALDATTKAAVIAGAKSRGVDPSDAIAEAERLSADSSPSDGDAEKATGRPTFERLLIGVLPFIRVHELRSIWLGLEDRVPDDEMMCGDFAVKHGGGTAATPANGDA